MAELDYLELRDSLLVPGCLDRAAQRYRSGERTPAATRLIADAEAALLAPLLSVIDKPHVPPTGDKRDYFSLSIYFWPDPSKPDGLPYTPKDGIINPEVQDYDYMRFRQLAAHVDTLALAYAISDDDRFAAKAAQFLRAWFLDERTGMKPNMLFAQHIPGDDVVLPWKEYPARFVPGTDGRKGVYVSFGGVIEDIHLIPFTDDIRILRRSPHWTDADDLGMRRWYHDYTQWLLTHQHGLDEAACRNNHGSWYWADIASFLAFTEQASEARRLVEQAFPERLGLQIEPDGSQPEELCRAVSQSYTSFTLCSFTNIAVAAQGTGFDAWTHRTPDGRSLRTAMDWFVPYLIGEKPWTWRQIKPFNATYMAGPLAACADHFPDARYREALQHLPLPADHRYRLIYDIG